MPASAQKAKPSSGQHARAEARAAYAEGQRLFEQGKFAKAEKAFTRAYEYVPNPVVLLALAQARHRQGNVAGAIEALEKYLAARPDAPDRADVQKRLEGLKSTPGTISVQSDPVGAAIALDGSDTGKTTPAELQAPPGEHTVTLHADGYIDRSTKIDLAPAGRQTVRSPLAAERPSLPQPNVMGAGGPVEEPKPTGSSGESGKKSSIPAGVWVSTGVAVSGVVAGTVLGFLALDQQSQFDRMPTAKTADKGERLALFADVSFGVAAGAAITGLVLYLTTGKGGSSDEDTSGDGASKASAKTARASVTPLLLPGGGGMAATVGF